MFTTTLVIVLAVLYVLTHYPQQFCEVRTIIIPILQMKKLTAQARFKSKAHALKPLTILPFISISYRKSK